jgi:hypothetical protein
VQRAEHLARMGKTRNTSYTWDLIIRTVHERAMNDPLKMTTCSSKHVYGLIDVLNVTFQWCISRYLIVNALWNPRVCNG